MTSPPTTRAGPPPGGPDLEAVVHRLTGSAGRRDRLTHLERLPARPARHRPWPAWTDPALRAALVGQGIAEPWSHQVEAAEAVRSGAHVVLATGTASGKSLGYLLPAVTAVLDQPGPAGRAGVLYLAPTKALAHDQLAKLTALDLSGLRATTYDGDSSIEERDWARDHATYVLTNPDMLHRTLLPGHARWASFLGGLTHVVVDECHHYRGVFGSHVAQILRRLRRLCAFYGSTPTFVLASATVAQPAVSARRLTGLPVRAVTDDGSPRGASLLALWEPPLTSLRGEHGAPVRRTATAEVADLMADFVVEGVRTLAFVRSRRSAETVALAARDHLAEVDLELSRRVAAYRGGYLPEDRREIERRLRDGALLGLSATSALELGVDIAGLDAVLLAGFPGTRAAMWQQLGRAGRQQQGALGVLVARDDPLDTYLVHHPDALLGQPVEATVFDPSNPYVLGPHLCAAAAELALTEDDFALFGPGAAEAVDALTEAGLLRRRPRGWFWTSRDRATDLADIRSAGGAAVRIVEQETGRVLGTVDAGSAHSAVHRGAVHLHQGETYVVVDLDLDESLALVEPAQPDYTTVARDLTDIRVVGTDREEAWGAATLSLGDVEVTSQVVAFLRRRLGSGEVLGEEPLDLPERRLTTKACWWTLSAAQLATSGVADVPGAAHAAEHASIGLLPLFATCDRWDIGGVSTALHQDTGRLTVFVYDGYPGGAGFAERGYADARAWLGTTRGAIAACECDAGCPSCVQSPKCGNGNSPLDKRGAIALLDILLGGEVTT
ncbi:MAG: DEAD/DEAH box helicase [Propionibacteriales bacterium]|nr:DEAD/DEAH box helicase [Propionibacteriales bacterium]